MRGGMESATKCVPRENIRKFITQCAAAAGASMPHAEQLAESLVTADYRGHFSHGLNRLHIYVNDLQSGTTDGNVVPVILKESPATAFVDGMNGLGSVVGQYCMDLAIEKAKKSGVGWVVAKGSNHYGIAGRYAMQAAEQGLVGFSFTNATPGAKAHRATKRTLGTNPISCAARGLNDDSFVLDMATTTVAFGKVEINQRKGMPIPNGWGTDGNGKETNAPELVFNGGALLPLGGFEESGGYKGFGLAMMVEVLCGIMAGSAYSTSVRKWGTTEKPANLGQCFVAVNPSMFADGFEGRLQDLMDIHRRLTPTDSHKPVLIAGDPERIHMQKCDELGGIPYPVKVVEHANDVARKLNVELV